MAIGEKFTIKDYSGEDKGIGFNSAFRISGTSLIPAGYDWDTCVNAIEPTTGRRGIAAAGANAFINQYY